VAALYESGVVGTAGLTIGFALILLTLWRASRRRDAIGPMAAAYLGSLISLLVAYQATNALNFSLIWLIAGAGLAMAFGISQDPNSAPESSTGMIRPGRRAHQRPSDG
jgi:peptidoglycan/LPS O-acetylase OafA/YrhL